MNSEVIQGCFRDIVAKIKEGDVNIAVQQELFSEARNILCNLPIGKDSLRDIVALIFAKCIVTNWCPAGGFGSKMRTLLLDDDPNRFLVLKLEKCMIKFPFMSSGIIELTGQVQLWKSSSDSNPKTVTLTKVNLYNTDRSAEVEVYKLRDLVSKISFADIRNFLTSNFSIYTESKNKVIAPVEVNNANKEILLVYINKFMSDENVKSSILLWCDNNGQQGGKDVKPTTYKPTTMRHFYKGINRIVYIGKYRARYIKLKDGYVKIKDLSKN